MASKRLIYKDEFGDTHTTDERINGKFVGDKAVREKLFEYEQEESEGKLIHLPCEIGDTVYVKMQFGGYAEAEVRDYSYFISCGFCVVVTSIKFDKQNIPFSEFGKTVFLTREEAESALNSAEKSNS